MKGELFTAFYLNYGLGRPAGRYNIDQIRPTTMRIVARYLLDKEKFHEKYIDSNIYNFWTDRIGTT
jgi:hypothetical protein